MGSLKVFEGVCSRIGRKSQSIRDFQWLAMMTKTIRPRISDFSTPRRVCALLENFFKRQCGNGMPPPVFSWTYLQSVEGGRFFRKTFRAESDQVLFVTTPMPSPQIISMPLFLAKRAQTHIPSVISGASLLSLIMPLTVLLSEISPF